jgi:hypothetical protein
MVTTKKIKCIINTPLMIMKELKYNARENPPKHKRREGKRQELQ